MHVKHGGAVCLRLYDCVPFKLLDGELRIATTDVVTLSGTKVALLVSPVADPLLPKCDGADPDAKVIERAGFMPPPRRNLHNVAGFLIAKYGIVGHFIFVVFENTLLIENTRGRGQVLGAVRGGAGANGPAFASAHDGEPR